jgi:adenylate cyclase
MLRRLIHFLKYYPISLRLSILSIFLTLFLIAILLLTGFMAFRFNKLLEYTSFALMDHVSASLLEEIQTEIVPVKRASQLTAKLIEDDVLNPDKERELVNYTVDLLNAIPIVQRMAWGDEQGDYIISYREEDGTVTTETCSCGTKNKKHKLYNRNIANEVIDEKILDVYSFDPRQRPWYIQAKNAKKAVWTDIINLQLIRSLALSVATPIYNKDGSLRGVFGLGIRINDLLNFISRQTVSPNGFTFIVTKDGKLIAFPGIKSEQTKNTLLFNIHAISKPWLEKSLDYYNITKEERFSIMYDNKRYLFTYKPIPELAKHGWLIGVVVPETDFTNGLEKINHITLISFLVILIICLLIFSSFVNRIVQPISKLVKDANKMKTFDLSGELHIKSRITEVNALNEAFQALKKALRSFQKYVPKTLINQMVEANEDTRIGGVRKELAILFSDIENFTFIAETMNPNQLMLYMCEYYEEMTQIVSEYGGTIDKYIGDSMMAFWGAPLPEAFPSEQAVRAALKCQKRLELLNNRWIAQGRLPLVTRIGLHLGDAVVGNLGSSERLNYTALGDTINIASRLEKLNKIYRTKIIVSEKIYHTLNDQFVMRMIDCVMVRGKIHSTNIYELIGETEKEVSYDVKKYNESFAKGFSAYKSQNWDEAIKYFSVCLKIYSNDTIAPLFIKRCQDFQINPPFAGWDGVWKLTE